MIEILGGSRTEFIATCEGRRVSFRFVEPVDARREHFGFLALYSAREGGRFRGFFHFPRRTSRADIARRYFLGIHHPLDDCGFRGRSAV